MIIGGMIMVFGGTIMTKRRDDYDNRMDELILISESGTPGLYLYQTGSRLTQTDHWLVSSLLCAHMYLRYVVLIRLTKDLIDSSDSIDG